MNGETEPLAFSKGAAGTLSLAMGSGETRRLVPVNRVLSVGSARDNDIVVTDRAVSAHHCRFQPSEEGVLVQDLSSRNGTWVDGVRVMIGRVRDDAHIRIGRTELHLCSARNAPADPDGLLAASNAMARVLMDVERFAKLPWPVLVLGESGVGKEGVARALHQKSARSHKPFVAINAGGISRELVESELFGHEKGSFTGAMQMHRGVFEQADGGTLFLDEIGELPLEMQSRLLRVLETWEVRRVGALSSVRVDVRLVCATHRDVRVMSADKSFRWDLYYRLARLVVEIPPLRTRPEDIRVLARHFLRLIEREVGPRVLTDDALARLVEYDWPGNARELRNVLSGAAAFSSSILDVHDIEIALSRVSSVPPPPAVPRNALERALAEHSGNYSATARALGIPRSTLRDRLKTGAKSSDT